MIQVVPGTNWDNISAREIYISTGHYNNHAPLVLFGIIILCFSVHPNYLKNILPTNFLPYMAYAFKVGISYTFKVLYLAQKGQ